MGYVTPSPQLQIKSTRSLTLNTPEKCAMAADIKIVSTEVVEKGEGSDHPANRAILHKGRKYQPHSAMLVSGKLKSKTLKYYQILMCLTLICNAHGMY